ncbi:hypothetical protein PM082_005373 [Marasmius tenuissimus]|nr:hypothetical protein PM082_005373 [Marasmius tenuissimus]
MQTQILPAQEGGSVETDDCMRLYVCRDTAKKGKNIIQRLLVGIGTNLKGLIIDWFRSASKPKCEEKKKREGKSRPPTFSLRFSTSSPPGSYRTTLRFQILTELLMTGIFNNKKATGFSNREEEILGGVDAVPFSLEDRLKEIEGPFEKNDEPWGEHVVVVDGILITGQNPNSGLGVGKAILAALQK